MDAANRDHMHFSFPTGRGHNFRLKSSPTASIRSVLVSESSVTVPSTASRNPTVVDCLLRPTRQAMSKVT